MKKQYTAGCMTLAMTVLLTAVPFVQAMTDEERDIIEFNKMFPPGEPTEEDFYRADRLLVSATGSLKPVRLAPSVASVITSEDIEAIGATTLDEVLETVPGLHVSPSGLQNLSSIWSIRGIRTNTNPQVLLLINGVPITETANGGRITNYTMPVAMISRVEVVRGPGSAIHGADAFSGTINVITKDAHEVDGTLAGIRYGSFDSTDAWMQHGGIYGGWELVASLESRKSQGDDERIIYQDGMGSGPPSLTPNELDSRVHEVDLMLGFNKEDRWTGHLYGVLIDDNGMGAGAVQTLNNGQSLTDSRQLLADISYHTDELVKNWDMTVKGNYLYQKLDNDFYFVPESVLSMRGNPIPTFKNGGIEGIGIYDGFVDHRLRLATGLKFFDMDTEETKNFLLTTVPPADWFGRMYSTKGSPDIFMEDQSRRLWYLSVQDEWNLAKGWELTAGVRYDEYDDFGDTINPRLALVWKARYDLIAKLMYGSAFRAPSFSEQHIQANPVARGNEDLDPETIDTYELAFDWQPTADLRIIPTFFYYEIDGLIDYVGSLPAPAENATDQKGHGFELDAQWQALDNLHIKGNLAYQRSEDKDSGDIVPDTPEWQFYTNCNWKFAPDWSLDGQYFWIADRHRAKGDVRSDIDDYDLVNFTLRRKNILGHWDWALSMRNLFNSDVREPSPYDASAYDSNTILTNPPDLSGNPIGAWVANDYPMESRAVWMEVRYRF